MTLRVLVCGSRSWGDLRALWSVLDGFDGDEPLHVISGGARGADRLASGWAERRRRVVDVYPANWDAYGRRAGYLRNQQMLDEGHPTFVLAFVDRPLAECRGTSMMVELARKAGVRTYVIEAL